MMTCVKWAAAAPGTGRLEADCILDLEAGPIGVPVPNVPKVTLRKLSSFKAVRPRPSAKPLTETIPSLAGSFGDSTHGGLASADGGRRRMQRWREQYLGLVVFLPAMVSAEIDQFFTLSREELAAVESPRGPLNRLSVGLQIGFLRMTGRTLNSCQILPAAVLAHLGRQLDLTPPQLASIRGLYRRKRTLFDHQRVAMTALRFWHLVEHAERGLTAQLRSLRPK